MTSYRSGHVLNAGSGIITFFLIQSVTDFKFSNF